jgi:hypothetical protein
MNINSILFILALGLILGFWLNNVLGLFIETTRATLSSHFQLTLRTYPLIY